MAGINPFDLVAKEYRRNTKDSSNNTSTDYSAAPSSSIGANQKIMNDVGLTADRIREAASDPDDHKKNLQRANVLASAELSGDLKESNADYQAAVNKYYNQLMGYTEPEDQIQVVGKIDNPIAAANAGLDAVDKGVGTVIDGLFDSTVGNLVGLFDEEAGNNVKNFMDAQTAGNLATNIGLAFIPGIGWALSGTKGLLQASDDIYSGITGVDQTTGLTMDDDQKNAQLLGALGSTALGFIPGGAVGVGVARNAGKSAISNAVKNGLEAGRSAADEGAYNTLAALNKLKNGADTAGQAANSADSIWNSVAGKDAAKNIFNSSAPNTAQNAAQSAANAATNVTPVAANAATGATPVAANSSKRAVQAMKRGKGNKAQKQVQQAAAAPTTTTVPATATTTAAPSAATTPAVLQPTDLENQTKRMIEILADRTPAAGGTVEKLGIRHLIKAIKRAVNKSKDEIPKDVSVKQQAIYDKIAEANPEAVSESKKIVDAIRNTKDGDTLVMPADLDISPIQKATKDYAPLLDQEDALRAAKLRSIYGVDVSKGLGGALGEMGSQFVERTPGIRNIVNKVRGTDPKTNTYKMQKDIAKGVDEMFQKPGIVAAARRLPRTVNNVVPLTTLVPEALAEVGRIKNQSKSGAGGSLPDYYGTIKKNLIL